MEGVERPKWGAKLAPVGTANGRQKLGRCVLPCNGSYVGGTGCPCMKMLQ
jgi:hypothetical protein